LPLLTGVLGSVVVGGVVAAVLAVVPAVELAEALLRKPFVRMNPDGIDPDVPTVEPVVPVVPAVPVALAAGPVRQPVTTTVLSLDVWLLGSCCAPTLAAAAIVQAITVPKRNVRFIDSCLLLE
jgi:hypothetical protein